MTFNEFVHSVPVATLDAFWLSPQQIYQVCEGYNSGKTVIQLGDEFNVSKTSIRRILECCGIKRHRRDKWFKEKPLTNELRQQVIHKYNAKKTLTEIQNETGLSYYIVRVILHEAELKRYKKLETQPSKKVLFGTRPQKPKAKHPWGFYRIRNDWEKGDVTIFDLAKIYNLSIDTIKWWLIKDGYGELTMAGKQTIVHNPELIANGTPAGELRRLCRNAAPELIQRLLERAVDDDTPTKELKEITELILDRGYGKPKDVPEEEEQAKTPKDRILKALPSGSTAKILNLKRDSE